jgi:hypothetical protein
MCGCTVVFQSRCRRIFLHEVTQVTVIGITASQFNAALARGVWICKIYLHPLPTVFFVMALQLLFLSRVSPLSILINYA